MYEVDSRDSVEKLAGVPQSSVGAPVPFVVSDELRVILAYYTSPGWDGESVRVVGPTRASEPLAIVRFAFCYAYMFGPPNDEAFEGHPLAERGLSPHGAFEVRDSSWIRRLERMNAVHWSHRSEFFWTLRHLVFAFHDSTFECVCDGFDVRVAHGSISAAVPEMLKLLEWKD